MKIYRQHISSEIDPALETLNKTRCHYSLIKFSFEEQNRTFFPGYDRITIAFSLDARPDP